MIYENYICIFNWKTKNKKRKTNFSERIKSEVVIMWFTYSFGNIDSQITFVNWSEQLVYMFSKFNEVSAFICSGSEFQIWGPKVLKRLSPYLAVLWTFTCVLFGLSVSHFVLWNISSMKAGFRLFRVLKTSNPSALRSFTSIVHTTRKTIFPKPWNIMESSKRPSEYYLSINFLAEKKTVFPISKKFKTRPFQ